MAGGDTNHALALADQIIASADANADSVVKCAQIFLQANSIERLEKALTRLVVLVPDNPEAWYDLAGIRALMGRTDTAIEAVAECVKLSNQRLKSNPKAKDLAKEFLSDYRFNSLKTLPQFQKIVIGK